MLKNTKSIRKSQSCNTGRFPSCLPGICTVLSLSLSPCGRIIFRKKHSREARGHSRREGERARGRTGIERDVNQIRMCPTCVHVSRDTRRARVCARPLADAVDEIYVNTRDEIPQGTGGSLLREIPPGAVFNGVEPDRGSSLSSRSSRPLSFLSPFHSPDSLCPFPVFPRIPQIESMHSRELRSCNRRQLDFNSIPFPRYFVVVVVAAFFRAPLPPSLPSISTFSITGDEYTQDSSRVTASLCSPMISNFWGRDWITGPLGRSSKGRARFII